MILYVAPIATFPSFVFFTVFKLNLAPYTSSYNFINNFFKILKIFFAYAFFVLLKFITHYQNEKLLLQKISYTLIVIFSHVI